LVEETKTDIDNFYTEEDLTIYLGTKTIIELAMLGYKEKKLKTSLTKKTYIRSLVKHYIKNQDSQRISTDNYMLALMKAYPHLSLEQITMKKYIELANLLEVDNTNVSTFVNNVLNDAIEISKKLLPTMTMEVISGASLAVNYINNYFTENEAGDWKITIGHCKDNIKTLQETHECGICYDIKSKNNFVAINCSHEFCSDCTIQYFDTCHENSNTPNCPMCRTHITNINVRSQNHYDEFVNRYSASNEPLSIE